MKTFNTWHCWAGLGWAGLARWTTLERFLSLYYRSVRRLSDQYDKPDCLTRLIKTCGLHLDFSPLDPHTNGVREDFLRRSLVEFDINFDESSNAVYYSAEWRNSESSENSDELKTSKCSTLGLISRNRVVQVKTRKRLTLC